MHGLFLAVVSQKHYTLGRSELGRGPLPRINPARFCEKIKGDQDFFCAYSDSVSGRGLAKDCNPHPARSGLPVPKRCIGFRSVRRAASTSSP